MFFTWNIGHNDAVGTLALIVAPSFPFVKSPRVNPICVEFFRRIRKRTHDDALTVPSDAERVSPLAFRHTAYHAESDVVFSK